MHYAPAFLPSVRQRDRLSDSLLEAPPLRPGVPSAAACSLSVRREMDALFGPEPKLVSLHGAPGPVVKRCAFQAKLGELVGDTVRACLHVPSR